MTVKAAPDAAAPLIVWFRQDLRIADNPALSAAAGSGRPLVLLYILDDETAGKWRLGGASRWWLHQSLNALSTALAPARLVLRRGPAESVLLALARETNAAGVYWNRCYEPFATARDAALKDTLKTDGREARSFNSALLFEPWEIQNGQGEAFKVFSPFWRAALKRGVQCAALPRPPRFKLGPEIASDVLDSWDLTPKKPDWAGGLRANWTPGEAGAQARLDQFLAQTLKGYADSRNIPGRASTSALSPHLHFGEIGPRQICSAIELAGLSGKDCEKFLAELGWREFSHHLLFAFPELPDRNWRAQFDDFPWADDSDGAEAWRRGRTGYPIVDAGMRQLWETGWMHNRVRMIVASFLVKHLLVDWRVGQDWFWDTLVDADLANNSASWQWVAGSGADAAPYFRIFNPVSQGETYDLVGAYVRRWVPELARLPASLVHRPWEAGDVEARAAGLVLGETYPHPIVDHSAARARALAAFNCLPKRS